MNSHSLLLFRSNANPAKTPDHIRMVRQLKARAGGGRPGSTLPSLNFRQMTLRRLGCVPNRHMHTSERPRRPRSDQTPPAIYRQVPPIGPSRLHSETVNRCGCVARAVPSSRGGGITQMPEIQSSESQDADRLSSILAGYLTPKNLAQALGVPEPQSPGGNACERARG